MQARARQASHEHQEPVMKSKPARVSHEAVLAYLAEHPDLKRVEVAAHLGISERKVYDALSWQKEHQTHAASGE